MVPKRVKCCVCCNNQNFDKHQKPEMVLWYLGFSDMITCRVSQCKALNDLELSLCLFRVDSLNFDLKDVVSQTCFTVLRNGRLATCRELSRDKHICETLWVLKISAKFVSLTVLLDWYFVVKVNKLSLHSPLTCPSACWCSCPCPGGWSCRPQPERRR